MTEESAHVGHPAEDACFYCKYWYQLIMDKELGECRRYAPRASLEADKKNKFVGL